MLAVSLMVADYPAEVPQIAIQRTGNLTSLFYYISGREFEINKDFLK